jgi:hypothetical protein
MASCQVPEKEMNMKKKKRHIVPQTPTLSQTTMGRTPPKKLTVPSPDPATVRRSRPGEDLLPPGQGALLDRSWPPPLRPFTAREWLQVIAIIVVYFITRSRH